MNTKALFAVLQIAVLIVTEVVRTAVCERK